MAVTRTDEVFGTRDARALLADSPRTIAIEGDAREPESILANPQLRSHIDFSQPVAVLFAALLHFVTDSEGPARIVSAFREAMVPGSGLVITHVVAGGDGGQDQRDRRAHRGRGGSARRIIPVGRGAGPGRFGIRAEAVAHTPLEVCQLVSRVPVCGWGRGRLGVSHC
jgi:hypothetical protein